MPATRLTHLTLLSLIMQIINPFNGRLTLLNSLHFNILNAYATTSVLAPNTPLSTLIPNILNPHFSHKLSENIPQNLKQLVNLFHVKAFLRDGKIKESKSNISKLSVKLTCFSFLHEYSLSLSLS
jgi:hypothetical protein